MTEWCVFNEQPDEGPGSLASFIDRFSCILQIYNILAEFDYEKAIYIIATSQVDISQFEYYHSRTMIIESIDQTIATIFQVIPAFWGTSSETIKEKERES